MYCYGYSVRIGLPPFVYTARLAPSSRTAVMLLAAMAGVKLEGGGYAVRFVGPAQWLHGLNKLAN
jgi:hypothetical protein